MVTARFSITPLLYGSGMGIPAFTITKTFRSWSQVAPQPALRAVAY